MFHQLQFAHKPHTGDKRQAILRPPAHAKITVARITPVQINIVARRTPPITLPWDKVLQRFGFSRQSNTLGTLLRCFTINISEVERHPDAHMGAIGVAGFIMPPHRAGRRDMRR